MSKIIVPFEMKSTKDDGTFVGNASPFGELDAGYDIVMKGAFKNTLADHEAKGRKVKMLWQHKRDQPIGIYPQLKETDEGLIVTGQCNLEVQQGRECHALMKQGALDGLSIGYNAVIEEWDDAGIVRKLHEVKLWEISPVTFPMADSARVALVKSMEGLESLADCEQLLRDAAGWSRQQVTAFTARIKAIALQSDSADGIAESINRALVKLKTA